MKSIVIIFFETLKLLVWLRKEEKIILFETKKKGGKKKKKKKKKKKIYFLKKKKKGEKKKKKKKNMATYSESIVVEKLHKLNESQESIQTLSQWLMYHKKNYKKSVEIWAQEIQNGMFHFFLNFWFMAFEN